MNWPLYTEHAGQGASVALLHGWGMNLRVFDMLRERLARRLSVTLADLPGHGQSPWPSDFSEARQLQALGRVLLPAETLIGWSLGGQLALSLALAHLAAPAAPPTAAAAATPSTLKRLVLIATTPRFLLGDDWSAGLSRDTLRHFATSLEQDPSRTIADFLGLQVRGSERAAATAQQLREALDRHGVAQLLALRAGLSLLITTDLRAQLGALSIPTLVIGGMNDRVTRPAALEALAEMLPHAHLTLLPRAGHAPFLSHPEAVAEAVLAFVAGDTVGTAPP
jgi:pimeloyl-[acyl-carrier protein] methyl ester esterase